MSSHVQHYQLFNPISEEAPKIAEPKTMTEAEGCPESHPFAYRNGDFCCLTNKDLKDNPIALNSRHCANQKYVKCPNLPDAKCKNYEGMLKSFLFSFSLQKIKYSIMNVLTYHIIICHFQISRINCVFLQAKGNAK